MIVFTGGTTPGDAGSAGEPVPRPAGITSGGSGPAGTGFGASAAGLFGN